MRSIYLTLCVALLWTTHGLAQSVRGSVGGTVTDASQKPLTGATITLTDDATNKSRTAEADARGDFVVTGVPPGSYHLVVEKAGYRKYVLPLTLALDQCRTQYSRRAVVPDDQFFAGEELRDSRADVAAVPGGVV
jgi:uncharacterized surface anchored protein